MQRAAFIAFVGTLGPLLASAQCTLGDGSTVDCGYLASGQNPSGDPSCGVDPQDFANSLQLGLNVCNCDDAAYTVAATFTGADAQVTTTAASAALASSDPLYTNIPFNFDEAYSSLPVGSDVTFNVVRTLGGQEQDYGPYTFNFQPITSIYSETTTEVNQEVAPATTETTTQTSVYTETQSVSQATVSANCATGTKTVYGPKITLRPRTTKPAGTTTYTVVKYSVKATPLACIPLGLPFKLPKLFPRQDGFERRQVAGGVYEQAYCPAVSGPPVSTTYTSTEVTTTTSTPTETSTEFQVSTTTITQAPNPATTTICKSCKATTTITPIITIPVIVYPGKTIVKTTIVKTVTVPYAPLFPKFCPPATTTKKPYHLPTGLLRMLPWTTKAVTTTRRH